MFRLAVLWWRLGLQTARWLRQLQPVSRFMWVFAQELYAGVGTIGAAPQKCAVDDSLVSTDRFVPDPLARTRLGFACPKLRPSPGGCSWTNWHGIAPLRLAAHVTTTSCIEWAGSLVCSDENPFNRACFRRSVLLSCLKCFRCLAEFSLRREELATGPAASRTFAPISFLPSLVSMS